MSESEFLTTEQRCDYLRVNERTVYRLRQAGRIPALRIGRLWRYRKSDIDASFKGHQPTAGGAATVGGVRE